MKTTRCAGRPTFTSAASVQFFDTDERRCTIYEARPSTCRTYPGGRCGYYDFLTFERNTQDDPEHVAGTWNK